MNHLRARRLRQASITPPMPNPTSDSTATYPPTHDRVSRYCRVTAIGEDDVPPTVNSDPSSPTGTRNVNLSSDTLELITFTVVKTSVLPAARLSRK